MNRNIAVAMSVYKSDSANHVDLAIKSILNQSLKDFHLYIEVDGTIDKSLSDLLKRYDTFKSITVNFNKSNKGLAYRLNQVIDKALETGRFNYIARMDADDISAVDRFHTQVEFLESNPDISVVGSDVIEIDDNGTEIFYKKMDSNHIDLLSNVIKKCPLNHPSVMFRIEVFNECYRYQTELKNTQDYYLWIDLLASGKKLANINKPLLYFRVNNNFHSRRGFNKAMNDLRSRFYAFNKLHNISLSNIIHVILLFGLRLSPNPLKKFAYKVMR
ncbi:glycosyltransferase [Plesiomonas shigelloides]|uniref:glycosyltransferase n=1 Tax=Plesiomonas shigelloides TaxID=703 RepID=UPI00387F0FA4